LLFSGYPPTHFMPAAFRAGIEAGMAWINASGIVSGIVWMPILGGISTRPSAFSRNISSSAAMISAMPSPAETTSEWER
jgi:hypothetical protein